MGGTIEITSAEGLGTRVTVTLTAPRASAMAIRAEPSTGGRAPVAVQAPAGCRLLIVDDHPVNLTMLQRQLKVLGLEADTAASGHEALVKWRRKRHSLIITDLQMPEMDGYAFARAIRAEQRPDEKPTVVAFTANTHREALESCMVAGMDDYLTKPTELAALREKLTRWLGTEAVLRAAAPGNRGAEPRGPAIDRAHILELVGGPDGVASVLAQVEAGARADITGLQAALDAADEAALRLAAHRIKGSALTIGARSLAAAAMRVEDAPLGRDAPHMAQAVHALVQELKRVLAATRSDGAAAAAA
jgi:CheY-like chemotaxis protein